MFPRRPVGILLGYLADVAFADPRRGHPVAAFGAVAGRLERLTYRDRRVAGAVRGANCLATIQAAVDAAHSGDVIHVGRGSFPGGLTIDKSLTLVGTHPGEGNTIIGRTPSVLFTIGLDGRRLRAVQTEKVRRFGRDPVWVRWPRHWNR